jgi:hypothetical protein
MIPSGGSGDGSPGTRTIDENEEWNSHFASRHRCLVISLHIPKDKSDSGPETPSFDLLRKLQSLFLAVCGDERLPIDRRVDHRGYSRTALLGCSDGARLAFRLIQMENGTFTQSPRADVQRGTSAETD